MLRLSDHFSAAWGALQSRLKSKTAGAFGAAGVWQASNYILALITFPYLSRALGTAGLGVLEIGLSIGAFAILITDWGFIFTATQAAAQLRNDAEGLNRLVWATIFAKLLLAVVACSAIAVVSLIVIEDPLVLKVLASYSLMVLGSVFNVDWLLRGTENLGSFAKTSIFGRLVSVPLVLLLVKTPEHVALAAFALAIAGPVTASLTFNAARKIGLIGPPEFSWEAIFTQIKKGAHIFLSTGMVNLYTTSLALILGATSGSVQVGLYSGANKIRQPVQNLFSPISMVFYPRISHLVTTDVAAAIKTCFFVLKLQVSISFLLAAALCIAAPFLVPLILGDEFSDSTNVLRILALVVFLIGTSNVLGIMIMLPFGLNKAFSRCIMAGAIVGVSCAIPFSYWWGAVGTALSAVCAETMVTGSMWLVLTYELKWFRILGSE